MAVFSRSVLTLNFDLDLSKVKYDTDAAYRMSAEVRLSFVVGMSLSFIFSLVLFELFSLKSLRCPIDSSEMVLCPLADS